MYDTNSALPFRFQHAELKKLSIYIGTKDLPFLSSMSFAFPNIKQLNLRGRNNSFSDYDSQYTINMPNSSLHQITFGGFAVSRDFKFYFRLDTETKIKYFIGSKTSLKISAEQDYHDQQQSKQCSHIICKNLNKLLFYHGNFTLEWTF